MGPEYPGVARGATQMESSSSNPDIVSTHADVIIDLPVSQPGELTQDRWFRKLAQSSWVYILDELPPDPRHTFSGSWGKTDCVGRSNPTNEASVVSADNAERLGGHNGDLDHTDTVSPPIDEAIHTSCPIPFLMKL